MDSARLIWQYPLRDHETVNEKLVRLHARIHGRVQGVNFRYYTINEARARGLSGWAANCFDGSVEVVAEGEKAVLQAFLAWLHRGSPSARVDSVEIAWQEATGEFDRFRVRYL